MQETGKTYIETVEGFADIAIEITRDGKVIIKQWPNYSVSTDTIVKVLRTMADNIEKIKNET